MCVKVPSTQEEFNTGCVTSPGAIVVKRGVAQGSNQAVSLLATNMQRIPRVPGFRLLHRKTMESEFSVTSLSCSMCPVAVPQCRRLGTLLGIPSSWAKTSLSSPRASPSSPYSSRPLVFFSLFPVLPAAPGLQYGWWVLLWCIGSMAWGVGEEWEVGWWKIFLDFTRLYNDDQLQGGASTVLNVQSTKSKRLASISAIPFYAKITVSLPDLWRSQSLSGSRKGVQRRDKRLPLHAAIICVICVIVGPPRASSKAFIEPHFGSFFFSSQWST